MPSDIGVVVRAGAGSGGGGVRRVVEDVDDEDAAGCGDEGNLADAGGEG